MPHTSYITNTTTSMIVDLKNLKATKLVLKNITALVEVEVPITTLVKKLSIYVTRMTTNVFVDGQLYTQLVHPTRFLSTVVVTTIVEKGTTTQQTSKRKRKRGSKLKTVYVR